MAPPTATQFVDAALFCTSPFALAYTQQDQKWLIRDHLLSLLQHFPALAPSTDTFVHDDGTTVNLIIVCGFLPISHATHPVPLTIWLHENYPYEAPIVFLSLTPTTPILHDHAFVDPSGATRTPYLQTWLYPHSNLVNLARDLACLFSHQHPFFSSSAFSSSTDPYQDLKMEALDRLMGVLHCDMLTLRAQAEEDIERLWSLQTELIQRSDITTSIILGLEHERTSLKDMEIDLRAESDMLINWLRVNDPKSENAIIGNEIEKVFEPIDDESGQVMDCLVADKAIEDLVYALDKAVQEGAVPFEKYIKQVRTLAKEQFYHKDMLVKLKLRYNSWAILTAGVSLNVHKLNFCTFLSFYICHSSLLVS